ncbi:hypothetical protein AAMO2058_001292300 [Amorphochlora amoebiformis]|uniref:AD domain-containing protein n=1 Tax=Amorphochlora amoebiformis TaxID=1561963 RepID=A0A7S0CTD7_9EUKA|mmetsp:Transcript_13168/g.20886  ORF Transcript_13168/g.20886 Transcript_13168/m.20886 type:complete len:172 (+) Transcript_13168:26-541(+)
MAHLRTLSQKQFLAGQLSYGSTVNIHTQQGTFEGVVDCIDVKAGCVAIVGGNKKITLISLYNIEGVRVLKPGSKSVPIQVPSINIRAISSREAAAIEERRKEAAKIGVGVSAKAQKIFNRLVAMFDSTRWEGTTIVIMDNMRLKPPYTPESCTGGTSLQLERVRKMIRSVV